MTTFADFWDTTGSWPDNILTSAFKELAERAWRAGKASTGLSAGVAVAFEDVIAGFHGHPGKPCWLGCCETLADKDFIPDTSCVCSPGGPCLYHAGKSPRNIQVPYHGQPLSLRSDIPEPPEGWTEHRARGCQTIHLDASCPSGLGPKEHCALRVAGVPYAVHDPKAEGMAAEAADDAQEVDPHAACLDPGCRQHGQDTRPVCPGCKQEIDPDTCGCGDAREGHGFGVGGHGFIPMGCDCFRSRE